MGRAFAVVARTMAVKVDLPTAKPSDGPERRANLHGTGGEDGNGDLSGMRSYLSSGLGLCRFSSRRIIKYAGKASSAMAIETINWNSMTTSRKPLLYWFSRLESLRYDIFFIFLAARNKSTPETSRVTAIMSCKTIKPIRRYRDFLSFLDRENKSMLQAINANEEISCRIISTSKQVFQDLYDTEDTQNTYTGGNGINYPRNSGRRFCRFPKQGNDFVQPLEKSPFVHALKSNRENQRSQASPSPSAGFFGGRPTLTALIFSRVPDGYLASYESGFMPRRCMRTSIVFLRKPVASIISETVMPSSAITYFRRKKSLKKVVLPIDKT